MSLSLEEQVVAALRAKNATLATAESCTGGMIAEYLTRVAGASQVFGFGWVTYAYEAKTSLLGVPKELLESQGAVNKETVLAMAKGALLRADSTYAIAVSGIAGPDGGSPEKPVGLVWMAWAKKSNERDAPSLQAQSFLFNDFAQESFREDFRRKVTQTSLEGLLSLLQKPE